MSTKIVWNEIEYAADQFKKHGFELKFFFSIFSKFITKSKLIKQMWSCTPMWHCKYSVNAFNTKQNLTKRIWKCQITVNLPAWRPKGKCYFNFFSPSIHWDTYSRKKRAFFSKLREKCQNLRNPWEIVNILFC